MKYLLTVLLFLATVVQAANPSFRQFNTNHFTTNGYIISSRLTNNLSSNTVTAIASNYVSNAGVNSNTVTAIASNYVTGVIPTFNPNQFGGSSGGTNLIVGALATNLTLQTTGGMQFYPNSSLKFNILGGNTNGSIIAVTNFNVANGLSFHLYSTNDDQRRVRMRLQGMADVTNVDAASSRVLTTGTNTLYTNGSGLSHWASIGINSTNTGTNVTTFMGLAAYDGTDGINAGTADAGFRRESSSAVVLQNMQGSLQKSLRTDSIFSGNRLETYNGLWIGTNATEQMVISGPGLGAGAENLHWANRMVVTNQFIAGTNALAGAGSTPTESYNTNYHTFALPQNAVAWSLLGDAGQGTNYVNVAMIVSQNNGNQTNRTEIRGDSINQTNRATGNYIIGTNGQLVVSGPGTNYFGANVNVSGTVNATGYTNSSLTASKVILTDGLKGQASTTATSSQLVAGDGSAVTVSTGLNLSGGNLTATGAGTASTNSFVVMTNGVLNNVNTNLSGGIQQVNFSAWNHTTGVNGRSSLILMVDQAGGTTFVRSPAEASIDTAVAVTLSQDYTNTCSAYLSNNATWYVTNATTGAGNDAGIISGTFQVATLGGSGTVTSVGASGPAGFTWSSPITGSGTLTATTPGIVVTNGEDQVITHSNQFIVDATHIITITNRWFSPTNAPTDGQVLTAAGTRGDTKWSAASGGTVGAKLLPTGTTIGTVPTVVDEWASSISSIGYTANAGAGGGSGQGANFGASVAPPSNIGGRFGLGNAITGTGTTGFGNFRCGSLECYFGQYTNGTWNSIFTPAALSDNTDNYVLWSGYGTNASGRVQSDGAYFQYSNNTNGGNWQGVVVTNYTEAYTNIPMAVAASSWYELCVFGSSNGVYFAISTNDAVSWTITGPVLSGLPISSGRGFGAVWGLAKQAGSTSRTAYVDRSVIWRE